MSAVGRTGSVDPVQVGAAVVSLLLFVGLSVYIIKMGRETLRTGQYKNAKTGEIVTGAAARRVGIGLVGVGSACAGILIVFFVLSALRWLGLR